MKVAVIGAGSTYTPELVSGLVREVIGRAMAGGVRRHVGQHHVGWPAEHGFQFVGRRKQCDRDNHGRRG